jgi:hypothetical protein
MYLTLLVGSVLLLVTLLATGEKRAHFSPGTCAGSVSGVSASPPKWRICLSSARRIIGLGCTVPHGLLLTCPPPHVIILVQVFHSGNRRSAHLVGLQFKTFLPFSAKHNFHVPLDHTAFNNLTFVKWYDRMFYSELMNIGHTLFNLRLVFFSKYISCWWVVTLGNLDDCSQVSLIIDVSWHISGDDHVGKIYSGLRAWLPHH